MRSTMGDRWVAACALALAAGLVAGGCGGGDDDDDTARPDACAGACGADAGSPDAAPDAGPACGCGDGTCGAGENESTCPADCAACPDGTCSPGEDAASCPADCDTCGDGVCQQHEDAESCAGDCAACGSTVMPLPPSGTATGDTTDETDDLEAPCFEAGAPDVAFTLTSPGDLASLHISLAGSDYDTALHVYRVDCGTDSMIACNDDGPTDSTSEIDLVDVARGTLQIVVDGYDEYGIYQLAVDGEFVDGEPCDPSMPFLHCRGSCRPTCDGGAPYACGDAYDCAGGDGIDNDGDGDIDEDTCSSPPTVTCPPDTTVPVLQTADLAATATDDGEIRRSGWQIVSAPAGARARLGATRGDATSIAPDVAGGYTLRYTAFDDADQPASCDVEVTAVQFDCSDGIDNDGDGDIDEDDCASPPVVGCPADVTTTVLADVDLAATVTDDGAVASLQWTVVSAPAGATAIPIPPDAATAAFVPDRPGTYRLRLTAIDDDGETAACEVQIVASGVDCADGIDNDGDGDTDEDACDGPPAVTCPDDGTVPAGAPFAFATTTTAGTLPVAVTRWTAPVAPPGSVALPRSTGTDAWEVTPLLAGAYTFRYTAVDEAGQMVACEFDLTATVEDALRVEIVWNLEVPEPLDASDVDLHLLHADGVHWFDATSDCYYDNCVGGGPMWGPGGAEDDPRLDIDDTEGRGPENINVTAPEAGVPYRIGVHYYDPESMGDAQVLVHVYCGGSLAQTFGPKRLHAVGDDEPGNDFWKVADVTFGDSGCSVDAIDEIVPAATARIQR
ncbi:MAG: hypothetical protein D6689_06880 [Deltaproteobacteria bacterium]|nr:MAG: hypothetical protein D6689_06880 [Deltaproteobacteria bacterium]